VAKKRRRNKPHPIPKPTGKTVTQPPEPTGKAVTQPPAAVHSTFDCRRLAIAIALAVPVGAAAAGIALWGSVHVVILISVSVAAFLFAAFVDWTWHIFSIRGLILIMSIMITCVFVIIIEPLSYKQDTLKEFRFSSDDRSAGAGITYDKCELTSMGNATDHKVLLWFGCTSPNLKKLGNDVSNSTYMYLFYGNCGSTTSFDRSLLANEMPDYVTEFPFNIDGIGQICQKRIYYEGSTVQRSEDVPLTILPAGHLDGKTNTLAVEWDDAPTLQNFSFWAYDVFTRVSYDSFSAYWDIDDQWKRDPDLSVNIPNSFVIQLTIPGRYSIQDQEKYDISHETHGLDKDARVVSVDLKQVHILHLVLVDNTKSYVKKSFEALFGLFVVSLFVGMVSGWMLDGRRTRGKTP
jgi:hypothetical protein